MIFWRVKEIKELDENEKLARLYLNLKGAKKKQTNWIELAEELEALRKTYGSIKKTADKLSVSYELIRSVLKLLTLPEEAKALIRNNEILYDAGQRIARINGKERQVEVAKAIAKLPAHSARQIIYYAKKYPTAPLENFRKRVVEGDNKVEKIHLTLIPLTDENYDYLKVEGKKRKLTAEKLILSIVNQWLDRNKQGEDI